MGKTLEQLGELGGDRGALGQVLRGWQCRAAPAGPGWGRAQHTQPTPDTHTLQGTAEPCGQGGAAAGKMDFERSKTLPGSEGKGRYMPVSTRG